MDASIRELLVSAVTDKQNFSAVEDAYSKLKRGSKASSGQPNPFSSDLYVICCEVALELKLTEIADGCIALFFQRTPPTNQFLCRAYFCQAKLTAPLTSQDVDKLEGFVVYLTKAINLAKSSSKYHFLVYNASVLYWKHVRPFLRSNCRHHLARSLHMIVKALDDIDDADHEWRAILMIALTECHIDAGRKEDAVNVSTAAMQFMKSFVPHLCKDLLDIQMRFKLIDPPKAILFAKSSPELSVYYKMMRLQMDSQSMAKIQLCEELRSILRIIVDNDADSSSSLLSKSSKNVSTEPEIHGLLLNHMRMCLDYELPEEAQETCKHLLKRTADPASSVELAFMRCELMVKMVKDNCDSYAKSIIEVRMNALFLANEQLQVAVRLGKEALIQTGCVTIWNLCLPLLQPFLRHMAAKYLAQVACVLEHIESLLLVLRCQVHLELAKCLEDEGKLELAINNVLKALELDDSSVYKSRLETFLRRLKLRALLYQEPERPEDLATMIIEQAQDIGAPSSLMKRASLMKAGIALAPDAFVHAMDGEEVLKSVKAGHGTTSPFSSKVQQYDESTSKIRSHLTRVESANDIERVQIWASLAKTARKEQIWDVARVASQFCLLYDDGRWSDGASADAPPVRSAETQKASGLRSPKAGLLSRMELGPVSQMELQGQRPFSERRDLMRLLGEISFVFAECLVQLLLVEGVRLLEQPTLPVGQMQKSKKLPRQPSGELNDLDWSSYCAWIGRISEIAVKSFHRAADIGVQLGEVWMVYNAGVYLWNYTSHLMTVGQYDKLTKVFQPIYDSLRVVGHGRDASFLCDLAHCLAQGYLQAHIPTSYHAIADKPPASIPAKGPASSPQPSSTQPRPNASRQGKAGVPAVVDNVAVAEKKRALEILEHALSLTSGSDPESAIEINSRHALIKCWTLCKGLLGLPLPKSSGELESDQPQGLMSRALIALEALFLTSNSVVDFQPCPNIGEVIRLLEAATWSDHLLEIEVWSRIAFMAYKSGEAEIALNAASAALRLKDSSGVYKSQEGRAKTSICQPRLIVAKELLHFASLIKGQVLMAQSARRLDNRRQALLCFVDACKYASESGNYGLTMSGAKHFWNAIHPLVVIPIERQLLREPLSDVLKFISLVSANASDSTGKDDGDQAEQASYADRHRATGKQKQLHVSPYPSDLSDAERSAQRNEDLSLRASLYGVLFQAYADKGELQQGLDAMNEAIQSLPRTHHRLSIFKHRVIANAKLDKPVQFDMGKFKDETESVVAQMWQRVAVSSPHPYNQMSAYVNAIEAVAERKNLYQKIEYLMEFSQWIFRQELSVEQAVDQLSLAISLLVQEATASGSVDHTFLSRSQEAQLLQFTDIRLMDVLLQLCVMIAELIGRQSPLFRQYCLTAAFLVQQIMQVSLKNAEKAVKDGVRPGERSSAARSGKDKKPASKSEKSAAKPILPNNLEAWATYCLPDKYKEHFKEDLHGQYVSRKSLLKPMLTLHYLDLLQVNLESLGFHHLVIPVILVSITIADIVVGNESLLCLMHMKAAEVCQTLSLTSAFSLHQATTEGSYISVHDLSSSHEEIENRQEKQRQVLAEEKRRGVCVPVATPAPTIQGVGVGEPADKPVLRRIWVNLAELLIKQAQYQAGRQLLQEASLSALAFGDLDTLDHVNYCLALIAYHETDWGKTVSLLGQSECFPDSLIFWMEKIFLQVEAMTEFSKRDTTYAKYSSDVGFQNAEKTLVNSLAAVSRLSEQRPSSLQAARYIAARFKYKLGSVLYAKSKELMHCDNCQEVLEQAMSWIDSSQRELSELGYSRESIAASLFRAEIQLDLALGQPDVESRKRSLLKALESARAVVTESAAVAHAVTVLSPLEVVGSMFLPIRAELFMSRFHFIYVVLKMLEISIVEKSAQRREYEKKDTISKLIDAYVGSELELTSAHSQWEASMCVAVEEAMMLASSVYVLADDHAQLKAHACVRLGSFLYLAGRYRDADLFPSYDWEMFHMSSIQLSLKRNNWPNQGDDSEKVNTDQPSFPPAPVCAYENAQFGLYLGQSVEYLVQAVQLGVRHGLVDVLSCAAFKLVELVGMRDPDTATKLLALYQSCCASIKMEALIRRALLDPHLSRSAALLRQQQLLKPSSVFLKSIATSSVSVNLDALRECEWWQRLQVSRNHFDIVKDLPFNATFVILQHSPDKEVLFGGILEKAKTGTTAKKREGSFQSVCRTMIAKCGVSSATLNELLDLCKQFKLAVSGELMRQLYAHQQRQNRQQMLGAQSSPASSATEASREEEMMSASEAVKLNDQFDEIVVALEAYLGTVLKQISTSLLQEPVPEMVVILADEFLMQFPLEALPVFRSVEIKSLSRDASLQLFHYRLRQESDGSDSKAEKSTSSKAKSESKAGKKEKGSSSSAKKAGHDKKGSVSKELVIDKDGVLLDLTSLRYVIDPSNDFYASDINASHPDKVIEELLVRHKQRAAKWVRGKNSGESLTVRDLQKLFQESSSIVLVTSERLLAHLPAHSLVPLDLRECNLAVVLDLVSTSRSFLRQANLDSLKSPADLNLESPVESSLLLSLCGVRSLVVNQWCCSVAHNNDKINALFDGMIGKSLSVAQSVRSTKSLIPASEVRDSSPARHLGQKGKNNQLPSLPENTSPNGVMEGTEGSEASNVQRTICDFQHYNTLVYGIPNFVLSLPG